MTNDKRPDQRFAMVAIEMTEEEIKPSVLVPTGEIVLTFDGEKFSCPRCGLSALEPVPVLGDERGRAACLACEPPAPTYVLERPLDTSSYRCSGCGKRAHVAVAPKLRDVMLHCLECKVLRLHSRQGPLAPAPARRSGERDDSEFVAPAPGRSVLFTDPPLRSLPRLYQSPDTPWLDEVLTDYKPIEEARRRPSTEEVFERLTEPLDAEPLTQVQLPFTRPFLFGAVPDAYNREELLLAKRMATALGLQDFWTFANVQARKEKREEDDLRRTGRTTRCLLAAIARCETTGNARLWVKTANPAYDRDLATLAEYVVRELVSKKVLTLGLPATVEPMPFGVIFSTAPTNIPEGTILYVDHSYYDSRFGGIPGTVPAQ